MSHFAVAVILPKGTIPSQAKNEAQRLLMPFWENDDGEPLNPESKWDWYRVGGRSDGEMLGLPARGLTEPCRFCSATGTRYDLGPEPKSCNACHGTGTEQRDGFNFGDEYETLERNLSRVQDITDGWVPFAFITPDGLWFGKGDMGWFGMVTAAEADDKWAMKWGEARGSFAHHRVLLVDCHV